MQLPADFVPIMKRPYASFEQLMNLRERVENGEGTEEEINEYDELFGPDQNCPDWKPYRHQLAPIHLLYFSKPTPPEEEFQACRRNMLKAYIHYQLNFFMSLDMAFKFHRTAEILFKPADKRIDPLSAVKIALFRREVAWPLWGSTRDFWLAFQDSFIEIEGHIYDWPEGEPDLSFSQIKTELLKTGDEVEAKFAEMLIAYDGDWKNICKMTTTTMDDLYLDM